MGSSTGNGWFFLFLHSPILVLSVKLFKALNHKASSHVLAALKLPSVQWLQQCGESWLVIVSDHSLSESFHMQVDSSYVIPA